MNHTNAEPIRAASRPSPCRGEFAYGIVPRTLIADIIDYERSSWGNHGKLVTAAQVDAEREHSK
jgi:hypothetical protein